MKTIYDKGYGDTRIILEEDAKGNLYLTDNGETRERVTPAAYLGWTEQRDAAAARRWLAELTEQFGGNATIARRFAKAAGAKL